MRLRIRSDGTPGGTHVYDEEGEEIHGIQELTVHVDVRRPRATVTITAAVLHEIEDLELGATGKLAVEVGDAEP